MIVTDAVIRIAETSAEGLGRCALHILNDDQNELGPGEIEDVYFDGPEFAYHNDPEKTARARNAQGWTTIGDVGFLDKDD